MIAKTVKRPYYSEENQMWALELSTPDGEFRGKNIDWCATQEEAERGFNRLVAAGYKIVEVEEIPAESDYQFPFVIQLPEGATVLDEMRVKEIAADYRAGKISHFEAREKIENRLQAVAFQTAKEEIQDISIWFDVDELNALIERREALES